MEYIISLIKPYTSTVITIFVFAVLYKIVQKFTGRHADISKESSIYRQLVLVFIVFIGAISVLYALPIDDKIKSNITTLLGYAISAVVALSSATFFGNMLAGILLRIISSFKPGDFIKVGDYLGKVSERGLFHTEMQTTDRDLVTLPNLFLAINPVKVTRSSGTFISTEVSLGYDVNRIVIEKSLVEASKKAGLDDPFVLITSLGDFSVVYKVHGLQRNVKKLLSSQSRLNAMVLDALHENNIEIVSPNFMNQRQVGETAFIPQKIHRQEKDLQVSANPEKAIFDKADEAESIEMKKQRLEGINKQISDLQSALKTAKSEEETAALQNKIDQLIKTQEKLVHVVSDMSSEFEKKK